MSKVWRSERVFRLCGWNDGNSFVTLGCRALDVQGLGFRHRRLYIIGVGIILSHIPLYSVHDYTRIDHKTHSAILKAPVLVQGPPHATSRSRHRVTTLCVAVWGHLAGPVALRTVILTNSNNDHLPFL